MGEGLGGRERERGRVKWWRGKKRGGRGTRWGVGVRRGGGREDSVR